MRSSICSSTCGAREAVAPISLARDRNESRSGTPASSWRAGDPMSDITDPFREQRNKSGALECEFQGEKVPMILRHKDVCRAAKDWRTFSSDAPFRVPIPSEEDVRTMRQLPNETDPPEHTDYREIVDPVFRRAKDPAVVARVQALIDELITDAFARGSVEVVRGFALPLQSRALTYLLNVPEEEAA